MIRGALDSALLAAVSGLALLMAWAPAADASSVTISRGDVLRVTETGNEPNAIAVRHDSGTDTYTVSDSAANLTAGASSGCVGVDPHTVTCPGTGIRTISVDTGARNDSIALDPVTIPATVGARLDGGSGDDVITGSAAGESIRGSRGNDVFDGGAGPDDIDGGGGTDTLAYRDRATGVNVTIGSGNGNDGGPEDQGGAGRDTVQGDIEVVIGTAANDVIVGDRSSERLFGLGGDDLLIGGGGGDSLLGFDGDDLLIGQAGNDIARGGPGDDRLFGKSGVDRLLGGPDDDFLHGGAGPDAIKGKKGIDQINARDGERDLKINCGPGRNKLEGAKWDKRLDPRPRSC